jgi:hypothetical protein
MVVSLLMTFCDFAAGGDSCGARAATSSETVAVVVGLRGGALARAVDREARELAALELREVLGARLDRDEQSVRAELAADLVAVDRLRDLGGHRHAEDRAAILLAVVHRVGRAAAAHPLGGDLDQVVLEDVVTLEVVILGAGRLRRQRPAEHEAELVAELGDARGGRDLEPRAALEQPRDGGLLCGRVDAGDVLQRRQLQLVQLRLLAHAATVGHAGRRGDSRATRRDRGRSAC